MGQQVGDRGRVLGRQGGDQPIAERFGQFLEQVGLLVRGHGGDQVGSLLDVQGLDQQALHLGRQLGQRARRGGNVEGLEDGRPLEAVEFLHDLGQFGRVETGELGLVQVEAQVVGE